MPNEGVTCLRFGFGRCSFRAKDFICAPDLCYEAGQGSRGVRLPADENFPEISQPQSLFGFSLQISIDTFSEIHFDQ